MAGKTGGGTTIPLEPGAAARLIEEVAKSTARGTSVRGRRDAARKARDDAQKRLEALRTGVKPPRAKRTPGARVKKEYPLTQRGQAVADLVKGTPEERKKARKKALTEFKMRQLISERRRVLEGEPAISKESYRRRRALLPNAAQARAELRAAETRARGRAYTSADVINQQLRDIRQETANLNDSIAKEKLVKKYGADSELAKAGIAAIEAKAAERAKKAAEAAKKRAKLAERFAAAENFTYVPKPRKPRKPSPNAKPRPKKAPMSERTKKERALQRKINTLRGKLLAD